MSERDLYAPMFGRPVSEWHRWFDWHPVDTVDRGWRWLVVVNRRRVHKLYIYISCRAATTGGSST